jgi:long-chain acyl-CoA synthetase
MTQISQLLRRAVQIRRESPASIFGERTRTWGQFEERTRRLAGGLRGLGLSPGDRIGILGLNSDHYLECLFGISQAGCIFVPINTRLAPPEISYLIGDAGCAALMVDEAFAAIVSDLKAPHLKHVLFIGNGLLPPGMISCEALVDVAQPLVDSIGADDELAGIYYTGGTTGRSKGVMLSHNNIIANLLNTCPEVPVDDTTRYVHAVPMFHVAGSVMTFKVTGFGGTHYFLPRFEPGKLLEMIPKYRITHLLLVPTMINMLMHHPELGEHDLSSLEQLSFGASPMPEPLLRRVVEILPQTRLVQAYGQSEASPVMTQLDYRDTSVEGANPGRSKSAGRAVLGCEVRILDENDNEVPRGTVGEICGRGAMVMLGYWNQPEVTERALRNGWLHTGDAGYMDGDGFVYVVDRMKDMVVTGGENVYSIETEEALYSHPAVAECAVIGVPDERWGERVHAVVRLKVGYSVAPEELIAHAHGRIAGYKCPRSVELRELPFPLSAVGKILKTELRKPYWQDREKQVN